jgi:hypothetical protein
MEASSLTGLRDRSLLEPETDTPFDHIHDEEWIQMDLTGSRKTTRERVKRLDRTYTCPTCGYEITESDPIG